MSCYKVSWGHTEIVTSCFTPKFDLKKCAKDWIIEIYERTSQGILRRDTQTCFVRRVKWASNHTPRQTVIYRIIVNLPIAILYGLFKNYFHRRLFTKLKYYSQYSSTKSTFRKFYLKYMWEKIQKNSKQISSDTDKCSFNFETPGM